MPLARFTVSTQYLNDPLSEVEVIVYHKLAHLRAAVTRDDNQTQLKRHRRYNTHANTVGICSTYDIRSYKNGTEVLSPLCATVRLAEPYLGTGVVTHEMCHAAVWIHERIMGKRLIVTGDDERFCWILGDLVRQVVNVLVDDGLYEKV